VTLSVLRVSVEVSGLVAVYLSRIDLNTSSCCSQDEFFWEWPLLEFLRTFHASGTSHGGAAATTSFPCSSCRKHSGTVASEFEKLVGWLPKVLVVPRLEVNRAGRCTRWPHKGDRNFQKHGL
jgi:hypothetical protein